MLPPEVLRIVLLIGLAATAYLMILAWNEDMTEAREPVVYSDQPLAASDTQNGNGASAPLSDTPDLTTTAPPAASDIPDSDLLVDESGSQAASTDSPAEPTPTGQWVKVTTPKLLVWIDLVGGDIVRVQLPTFPIDLEHPDVPYGLLDRSASHTYIAQSGLIGEGGPDSQETRPVYTTPRTDVIVAAGETREVVLQTPFNGTTVNKTFTFRGDEHLVEVEFSYTNTTDTPTRAGMFVQIKRDNRPPPTDESFSLAPQPYLGAALTTPEERYLKLEFDDIDDDGRFEERVQGGWMAFLQHYFVSAWVSPPEQTNNYFGGKSADGTYLFGYTGPAQVVAPGASGSWRSQFYAGPKDQNRLEEIAPNLNLTVDYGILWWLAVPLFSLLDWLHGLVGNWGVAIILLTVVVKILLYPLSAAGYKSMANMRRVAPAMKKLQERYSNDREKLSREMMALYKKEGANPLGGCLPMLLPMPIFIALYWVLFESVELRQAPFYLWIEDLAVMDPYFVLPLAMGASMYWMQSLNPQVGDPMQVKMMKMMPIMFTVLFLFFPAGLVLYWLVNNVLSVAQQQFIYRQVDKAQAAGASKA